MNILTAAHINKSFGIDEILRDVSFSVAEGDRVGIVGANGAGKSTLIRILAGELSADEGDISFAKGASVGYLKQRDHFPSGGTVLEEMDAALSDDKKAAFEYEHGYSYESGVRGILRSLAFNDDYLGKKVDLLSGGERTRLALAALLLQEPDLLLLDEPTNHLDIGTLKWLENYLKSYKGSILVISHDRYFLDVTVNRIFEIERHKLTMYKGNYSEYKVQKQQRYEEELKHYELVTAEIARQQEIIRRFKEHNTEHLVKRAQSREKRLAMLDIPEKPEQFHEKLSIRFSAELNSGNDVVYAEDLSKSFGEGEMRRVLFTGVGLDIKRGERICIVGPNGIGKTTLLKIILGELTPDSGFVRLGTNVVPGYYDQEQRLLDPDNTVLNEVHSKYIKYDQTELRSLLGRFMFHGDDVFRKVRDLAGGEKAKLSLLKLMMSGANLLIMDEPTNHLDIKAKEVFEDALLDFPGTLIIVSHDRYLLSRVATSIYELSKDGIRVYPGGYEYYTRKSSSIDSGKAYLSRMAEANKADGLRDRGEAKLETKEERAAARLKEREEAAAKRRHEKALAAAEEEISRGEAAVKDLEARLCLPEVFSDSAKAAETTEELRKAKEELAASYDRWMELQSSE